MEYMKPYFPACYNNWNVEITDKEVQDISNLFNATIDYYV